MKDRVLVIAPSSDLEYQENEVDGLLNTLSNAVAITGNISEKRLVSYFEERCEGIWFTGHGAIEGVLLGNETLNADALVSYINRAQASWVVLNVCESDQLINKLLLATSADVLVVSNEILDLEAWRMARLVAMEMAAGADIREAVENILPSQAGRHRFYPNKKRVIKVQRNEQLNGKLDELLEKVGSISERLAILETKVDNLEDKIEGQKVNFLGLVGGSVLLSTLIAEMLIRFAQ
jgi:hypothetical protein